MMGQSVYILADTFFISVSSGADGLAVLNLILPVFGMMFAIGSMIGIGSATRYGINRAKGEEADHYFRDLWLVVYGLAALIVTGSCPYSDRELGQILTGFSVAVCKAIKEIPGFAAGGYDRDAVFRSLIDR